MATPGPPGTYQYPGWGFPPPPPPRKRKPLALVAAVVGGLVLLVGGAIGIKTFTSVNGSDSRESATQTAPSPTPQPDVSAAEKCSTVPAEMLTLQVQSPDEPVVRLPLPRGWDRSTKASPQMVRAMLRATSLASEGNVPTAVVAIAPAPGNIPADTVFDLQLAGLKKDLNATVTSETPTTICGLTARNITYTASIHGGQPHPLRVVVVADHAKPTYVVTLTVQSLDPDNPAYRRDADTLLTGLQVLPAGSR